MRTNDINLYKKINKMLAEGKKQRQIVAELSTSFTTISKAKDYGGQKEPKGQKGLNYKHAIEMLLANKFFPATYKKMIRRYLEL